jgi:hypothetical protein
MPTRGGWVGLGCVLLAVPAGAAAQGLMTAPIGFRSGFTEGAVTTRPGTLTVDAGASARWAGGTRTYRAGEFNLRVPAARWVEARLYLNSYAWRRSGIEPAAGREDVSVAVAATLLTHRGLRPVSALIIRLDAPTGSLPDRSRSWRPSARLSLGWELPGRVALHGNLGVADDGRAAASAWVSRRVAGPLGAYIEAYGWTRERAGGPSTAYLHGAITCLVRSWMHVDLHAGLGSAAAGSPRWIGIGVRQRVTP